MSIPRFFIPFSGSAHEGLQMPLGAAQARHLWVLRTPPGSALELVLESGPWRADLSEIDKDHAMARLVAPLREDREAPVAITAYIPVTAQLSLLDDLLPPLVELGATQIQPVAFRRSEYDAAKTAARFERWQRIVHSACEQSHRSKVPGFALPVSFEALLEVTTAQRWVAHELPSSQPNPVLTRDPVAFTSGPEGGLTDGEYAALTGAGWQSLYLGGSILRAVTCPVAVLGAIRFLLPR
ncbi:MAG: RsmE family RNA methyltransferase [Holophaga sp.]|nr:RsmE family RNA methyltransferase [Holophaga sp.]